MSLISDPMPDNFTHSHFCIIHHVGANQRPRCIMSSNTRIQFSPAQGQMNHLRTSTLIRLTLFTPSAEETDMVLRCTFGDKHPYVIVHRGSLCYPKSLSSPSVGRATYGSRRATRPSKKWADVVHMTITVSSKAVIQDR